MPLENDYYKGDYKSSQLYKLKGPSRTPIIAPGPNVAPLATTPIPDDTEQTSGGDNLGNLLSLAMTLKGGGSPGSIPGQLPGTEFNMGAVNMPGTEQRTPTTSREFDADKFARMAGAFGAAISPRRSWQARMGATASGLAAENLKERRDAPGRALDTRYKEAQIKNLETPKTASTAMGAFLKNNPDATNDEVADYALKLKGEGKGPTTAMGSFLTRNPEATDEEVANYSKSLKDGGYHYETDDTGKVSVYQNGKLVKGPGKGKSKSAGAEEMTESKARKELLNLAKYKQKLSETGGMDDILFAMISRDNPELAESLRGSDKTEILNFIEEQEGYYRKFAPGTKSKGNKPSWKDYK